jgi:hypothetical protein
MRANETSDVPAQGRGPIHRQAGEYQQNAREPRRLCKFRDATAQRARPARNDAIPLMKLPATHGLVPMPPELWPLCMIGTNFHA